MKKSISTFLLTLLALFTCQQTVNAQQAASFYFEPTEVTYDLNSKEAFVAPTLVNPDNVVVFYKSSDNNIAQPGYYSGEITFFGYEGEVTITAVSTDDYVTSASYTIKVIDSRQDSGIEFPVEEITYDITSGEPFVAPELINPNNVDVIYTNSNWNVADVDYKTGAVNVKGVGTTKIGAGFNGNESYKSSSVYYQLTVYDPEIIASYTFSDGLDGWVEEGSQNVWKWSYYGYMYADGKYDLYTKTDSYFISPELDFSADGNILIFDHMAANFTSWADQAHVVARVSGGEWIDCGALEAPSTWDFTNSGKIKLPEALNGKKGQIAFKYTADGSSLLGEWYIKNIFVKKYVKKENPQISFDVTELTHDISETFEEPVLNNPNDVEVQYSTSDFSVASVDAATGKVTFYGEGTVTITATSKESKKFDTAQASYTITVTDNSKILTATFAYDLCGFTEDSPISNIWKYQYGYACASGGNYATESTNCFLVSPEISLRTSNTLEFTHISEGYGLDLTKYLRLAIRESNGDVKGEWIYLDIHYPAGYAEESSGLITLPKALENKTAQIAFVYTADGNNVIWWIRNLVIRGIEGTSPVDPEIAFDAEKAEYTIGSDMAFAAPKLINPNNVAVTYSSSDANVATVDAATGEVTFVGAGVTTITAESSATDAFIAAKASYELTVIEGTPSKYEEIYSIVFDSEDKIKTWTKEGYFENQYDFTQFYNNSMTINGYMGTYMEDWSYVVSPVIVLSNGDNVIEFTNTTYAIEDLNAIGICVRTVGGEWTAIENAKYGTNFKEFISSGKLAVPAEFAGKEVQFGFKYTANTENPSGAGNLYIQDFKVYKKVVEKADPQIAFDKEAVEVFFDKNNQEVFEFPQLVNPNNVPVKYSVDNALVATVDELTGVVTVLDYGVAVISATSEETDEFKSATVSYTLTVSVPTGISGITADDLRNGKVYNLQGVRVDKLGKGVYIVNGKKVVIK